MSCNDMSQLQDPPGQSSQPIQACRFETDEEQSAGLSFIDLLYAVPVVELATRIGHAPSDVTVSGWTGVAVALTAVTLGWVGHHTNRKQLPDAAREKEKEQPFTTARFPQFVVEILIIVGYFALVTLAVLDGSAPSEVARAAVLTGIFALYLVWDSLDIHIAKELSGQSSDENQNWPLRARLGAQVTVVFVVVFALSLIPAFAWPHPSSSIAVGFDLAVIVALYLYRVVQETCIRKKFRLLQKIRCP
jgi:hypothetical protein